jgi:AcrR family transcriptional regulator
MLQRVAAPVEPDGRRQRSGRTRARVIEAATRLFVTRGYVATTIEAVAEHAGVAVPTVYYAFGTKRNLLAAVLDVRVAGDGEPLAVLERSWFDALSAEPDAGVAVAHMVDATVAILARTSPIYEVVRRAAADPDVAALLDDNRQRRRADQRHLIEVVAAAGHLRPDLHVDAAADITYGLLNEEVFQLLTTDCAWSVERFGAWATELMLQQLVLPGSR